jgi:hypothetical protein
VTAPFDPAYGDVVEAPTVSPDFTVADVLAFARSKPADEAYDYEDPCCCALGQFIRDALGTDDYCLGNLTVAIGGVCRPIPSTLHKALRFGDWTFGALVKRLEAIAYRGRVG